MNKYGADYGPHTEQCKWQPKSVAATPLTSLPPSAISTPPVILIPSCHLEQSERSQDPSSLRSVGMTFMREPPVTPSPRHPVTPSPHHPITPHNPVTPAKAGVQLLHKWIPASAGMTILINASMGPSQIPASAGMTFRQLAQRTAKDLEFNKA
jgi:hypothetical protein